MHFLRFSWRSLIGLAVVLLSWAATGAFAQQDQDPPGRVAHLSYHQGSVVFAPQGEDEWTDLPRNRPLTIGDRLWTDRGSRAELQLGTATLHMDDETHLGLSALDEQAAQFILQQGTVQARVRDLLQGENFEIDTPNLALRALQPGDYRVDVDAQRGQTRVSVQGGRAVVFGDGGQSTELGAGQQATFVRRDLAQVQGGTFRPDEFSRWASERNRIEDQSAAARYVPRGVVGYSELDPYGQWGQDPEYGAVWYPQVAVQDWAPYRYGHWDWVAPWGWTWIDDAPWGFAPFHYGRWTMIGNRWAWVPGSLAARPLYAPALVAFLGGGSGVNFSIATGPAVGWYPLAPGEAWWPTYRTSPRYVNRVNTRINIGAYPRDYRNHVWRQRPWAVTAVGEEDFRRGRPAYRHRQALDPEVIGHARVGVAPPRPLPRENHDRDRRDRGDTPRLQAVPPRFDAPTGIAPAVREQWRAQQQQDRLQRNAEREAREQQLDQQRRSGEIRIQPREQVLRSPEAPRLQEPPQRQQLQVPRQQPQVDSQRLQREQQLRELQVQRQQQIQQQDQQAQQLRQQQRVQQQQAERQQQIQQRQVELQRERAERQVQQQRRIEDAPVRATQQPPPAAPEPQVQPQVRPQVRQPQAAPVAPRIQEPRQEREERDTGARQRDEDGPVRLRNHRD